MTINSPAHFFLLLAGLLVPLWAGAALAQSNGESVFVVTKVPVEADGADTATAQRIARDSGRRRAMDILLRRITAEDDWVYLPRLALGQAAPADGQFDAFGKQAVSISPADLKEMEEGFAVFDEKASRSTYRASITYRFKPDAVRGALKLAHIPYSESQTRKALLLPVLQTANGVYLWETNNPWARAWLVRPLVNELTPMALPVGDMADVQTITARQALALNQSALSVLAKRYGVSQIIVAHGYLSSKDGQYSLRVRYLNAYLDSAAKETGTVSSANSGALYDSERGYGASGGTRPAASRTGGAIGNVLTEAWFKGSGNDFPALARRAVTSSMAIHGKDWKRRTLVDHSATSTIVMNAYFTSLAQWAKIRQTLENSPNVESIKTGALSPDGATITVVILGDVRRLVTALRQVDLVLWQNNTSRWNIAPSSIYGAIRERVDNAALSAGHGEFGTDPTGTDPSAPSGQERISNPFAQPEVEWRGASPADEDAFSPPTDRELGPQSLDPFEPETPETGNGEGTILEQSDDMDEEEENLDGIY